MSRLGILALLAAAALVSPVPARAAESLDTCTGIIASVPAVISTQGTWCMDRDLATASPSVQAITITTNNVTIDCNHFKLGNLAAGPGTFATAIAAENRINLTVRNCSIRGFNIGFFLGSDGGGHLIEDNRLEGVTGTGMYVVGEIPSLVQRNRVIDLGGAPGSDRASAILVLGDALDNTVDGVFGADDVANFAPTGIYAGGFGGTSATGVVMRGNRIRNLVPKGTYEARALSNAATGAVMIGNQMANFVMTPGPAMYCSLGGRAVDNLSRNYSVELSSCTDGGGNESF